jgi:hypothetical protein
MKLDSGELNLSDQGPAKVVLVADEIKHDSTKSPWCYLGLVSFEMDHFEGIYNFIQDSRKLASFENEVKFDKIQKSKGATYECAKHWLPILLNPSHALSWSVIALNTGLLSMERFGEKKGVQSVSMRRRFLRAMVQHHLKSCYVGKGREVVVQRFFHDNEGSLEADSFFDWHGINWMERNVPLVTFSKDKIEFVDSDHRIETRYKKASHLVQLSDVLLGAVQHAHLDWQAVYHPKKDPKKRICSAKDELGMRLHPMLERMCCPDQRKNVNSRYGYVGRCQIGFFPGKEVTLDGLREELLSESQSIHRDEPLMLAERLTGQGDLFKI